LAEEVRALRQPGARAVPLQPTPRRLPKQVTAGAYDGHEARLKQEAKRLGLSFRELTAHIFEWWLEALDQEEQGSESKKGKR
jgi:hypothetical protein